MRDIFSPLQRKGEREGGNQHGSKISTHKFHFLKKCDGEVKIQFFYEMIFITRNGSFLIMKKCFRENLNLKSLLTLNFIESVLKTLSKMLQKEGMVGLIKVQ